MAISVRPEIASARPVRADSQSSAVQPVAVISRAGERRLREALRQLRHELDVEFASRLNEARAFGEVGNNDEYLQIREEAEVLAAKVAWIEQLLQSARVANEEDAAGADIAAIGTTIAVEDASTGAATELHLVGDYETAGRGTVSASSPMGRALLGRRSGSEVEAELPGGRTRRLRVLSVRARS